MLLNSMKIQFKHLIFGFAIIFFISLISILVLMSKSDEKLNRESKAYIDNVLPIILKNLNKEEFLKFASPKLIKAVPPEKFDEVFNVYKKLGKFEKYLGSKGKAKKSFTLKGQKWIYAKYTAKAKFSNGEAIIKVVLMKENGNWSIYSFKINSKVFNNIK